MTSEDDDWGLDEDVDDGERDDRERDDDDLDESRPGLLPRHLWPSARQPQSSADAPADDGRSSMDRALSLAWTLHLAGVTDVVLAPGSRSGPLALVLHRFDADGRLRLHVRVDEREAAFLALGLAKASGRAVPVVTTSGTAAANLHPAMLEALHAGVPVLAVTADRPTRLRFTGANQTTDQVGMFPGVETVRALDDLEVPADRPLHLNLELDEPLVAPLTETSFFVSQAASEPGGRGEAVPLMPGPLTLVIAGDRSPDWVVEVAARAGWPVVAEPSSGARRAGGLVAGRVLLDHAPLTDRVERVVSTGHSTLTRPVTRLLARTDIEVLHVGDQSTFPVPAGPNVRFVDEVAGVGPGDPRWLEEWQDADRLASAAVADGLDGTTPLDVARTVWDAVEGGLLVVGSSSPIRDLDLVARPHDDGRLVLANRGLAGIDGTISTAVGAALADQVTRPGRRALALMGDLTFLHGSNGLLIGPAEPRPDLTIVVADDDGGSIFATLEQGAPDYEPAFERVFATPTGTDLAALCAAHHVPHRRVEPAGLDAALGVAPDGIEVISVPVDRSDRRALDVALRDAALAALGT